MHNYPVRRKYLQLSEPPSPKRRHSYPEFFQHGGNVNIQVNVSNVQAHLPTIHEEKEKKEVKIEPKKKSTCSGISSCLGSLGHKLICG